MKIMLFITGLGMGGAEKVVCELADKLYESGQDVSIVYFFGEIVRRPKNKEISIYKVSLNYNLSIFKALNAVIKLVDHIQPHVIHSHMFHANMMARFVKMLRKNIRVICSSHSNYEGGRLRMAMYRLTENLCDVHTNVSDNAAKALMKAGAVKNKKIMTVYNGIESNKYKFDENIRADVRKNLGFDDNLQVILTIGRIDTPKDYPTLLKAFKIVQEEQKNTILIIVGDGPKRNEIENLAIHLAIEKNVKFLGIRDDIPQLLNACDLFVSASAWEGFGIAILEAMLCQRRIVATKTDGAMELLSSNLIDVGQPQAISKMIINVLNHQENIMRYPKANSFDWKFILEKWLNLYQDQVK